MKLFWWSELSWAFILAYMWVYNKQPCVYSSTIWKLLKGLIYFINVRWVGAVVLFVFRHCEVLYIILTRKWCDEFEKRKMCTRIVMLYQTHTHHTHTPNLSQFLLYKRHATMSMRGCQYLFESYCRVIAAKKYLSKRFFVLLWKCQRRKEIFN